MTWEWTLLHDGAPMLVRRATAALLLPLVASAVHLAACSGATVAAPPPPVDWRAFEAKPPANPHPVGPTLPEQAIASWYATAVGSADFAALAPRLDPDARATFPGLPPVRGRQGVVRLHEILFGAFDPRRLSVDRVWRTDSAQALAWTLHGTQAQEWMGIAATGRPVNVRGLTLVWTKDDGSLTDLHLYFDVGAVRVALGAPPDGQSPAAPSSAAPVRVLGGDAGTVAVAAATDAASDAAPGAQEQPQVFDRSGSADEARNVAVVRAWLDAIEANDEAAELAPVAEDVVLTAPEAEHPVVGREGMRAYLRGLHKAIGQLDTTIENIWGAGPYVVLEYSVSGEQLGRFGWVPPQRDQVIRLHVADVIEMRTEHIARVSAYDNPAELLALP